MKKLVLIALFIVMMMTTVIVYAEPSEWVPANTEDNRWQLRENDGFLEFRYNLHLTQLAVRKGAKSDSDALFATKSNTITRAIMWWDFEKVDCIIGTDAITARIPFPKARDYTWNLDIYVGDQLYYAYIDKWSPFATKPNNKNADLHQSVRITESRGIIPTGNVQIK